MSPEVRERVSALSPMACQCVGDINTMVGTKVMKQMLIILC